MIILDNSKTPTCCLNWALIARDKFPAEYNDSNVKEDFELLFQDQIDPVKLKDTLRNTQRQPNQAVRKFLWKRILLNNAAATGCSAASAATSATSQSASEQRLSLQATTEGYNKKIAVLFGKTLKLRAEMPGFVDKERQHTFYYLNEEGRAAVSRLLNVLASAHPDITFAPLLVPLASLFLHYMSEAECYACLLAVCETKLTQTDMHWLTSNHVFRKFAHKYTPAAYAYLLESVYRETNDPDVCFDAVDEWQWWIFECLPFHYVLNIVDSFLLEGQKVLLRVGLALLSQFHKHQADGGQPRPKTLKADCMRQFCARIHTLTPYERLIKLAFGYRNMSRRDVENVFQAEEKLIKKLRAAATTNTSSSSSESGECKRILLKRLSQQQRQEGLIIGGCGPRNNYKQKIYSKVVGSFRRPNGSSAANQIIETCEVESDMCHNKVSDSCNLSEQDKTTLMALQLNASTNSVGSTKSCSNNNPLKSICQLNKKWYLNSANGSSHSFYSHHTSHHHHHHTQASNLNLPSFSCENIGSSILSPEQIAIVWRWLPTRYQILELQLTYSTNIHGCRLMTLFDKIEYYQATLIVVLTTTNAIFGAFCSQPWSNRTPTGRQRRSTFFGNGETFLFEVAPRVGKHEWVGRNLHGETEPGQEMFQFADKDKLIIGGGSDGAMGLIVDSDLAYGRTSTCETFKNAILGNESDFEIAVLEVFSFDVGQNG